MAKNVLDSYEDRMEPDRILLVTPEHYDVVDVKNPYMKGNVIDHKNASEQWKNMFRTYKSFEEKGILKEAVFLNGVDNLEDMVYCANQSLPWKDKDGCLHALMSNMRFDSRKREVPHFQQFFSSRGYNIHHIDDAHLLEGMGDCIFHPFKRLLWMGHGFRTSVATAHDLEIKIGMPVIPLKLVSDYFYHLDTCFLPADDRTVFLCKEAFDQASLNKISAVFETVIDVARQETIDTFELNTHCIYNRENPVAVTPKGNHAVKRGLEQLGYSVTEVDTSEFIKGGGSVFCMKLMFY